MTAAVESLPRALDRVYAAICGGINTANACLAAAATNVLQHDRPCMALQHLQSTFGLTSFERDVLLLCAGAALETRFLAACAAVRGDPDLTAPTLGLALSTLRDPHWSTISRVRPLRYWQLLQVGPGPLLHASLCIDERILQFLLGVPASDERLEGLLRQHRRPANPAKVHGLERAAQRWQRPSGQPEVVLLVGEQASMRMAAFTELCDSCGCQPYSMHAAEIPANPVEREQLARRWTREAALGEAALFILTEGSGAEHGVNARHLTSWLSHIGSRVALEAPPGSSFEQMPGLRVDLQAPSAVERKAIWNAHMSPLAHRLNGDLDRIVEYFHFDAPGIEACATAAVEVGGSAEDSEDLGKLTWRICRRHARRTLDNLAHRVEPRASWEDLVLPPAQTQSLRQIAIHMRQRAVVNEQWGFSDRHSSGLGLSALFAGASGTGKTLAAEILAAELDLDLYRIDLATVVSKYIGETEKNLRRVFDAAQESGAILLFDEADALFGRRSEVRDSHDRYANLEVSYLLQRMDTYRGVAVLTTNMQHALDPAFLRRIRFIVQFPFPDSTARARIWQRIFPTRTPLGQLNFERLAQLNVTGGAIRNIAMHAAFLAAEARTRIELPQVLAAARIEYAKLEKPLTATEIKGWI